MNSWYISCSRLFQAIWFKIFFLALMLAGTAMHAQIPDEVRNNLERFLENQGSGADFTEISDELSALYQRPLNINRASVDELLACPLLDPQLVLGIIEHRRKFGSLLHVNELQLIPGFSRARILALIPFIRLEEPGERGWKNLKQYWNQGNAEALWYTLVNSGTQEPRYSLPDTGVNRQRVFLGDPLKSSMRLRYYKSGIYSLALTAEKDPGEPWWQRQGPDFISGHLCVEELGPFKRVIIGDYLATFGQGLLMGSGLAFSQSANVMNIKRTRNGIRPYRSVNEIRFFRGLALSSEVKGWQFNLLLSNNKSDGTRLNDSTQLEEGLLADFYNSGLHRTRPEIAARNRFNMPMAALALEKKLQRGNIGVSYRRDFSKIIDGNSNGLYQWYSQRPAQARLLSVYGDYTLRNVHVFFEQVRNPKSPAKPLASVAGILVSLASNLDVSMLHRNYSNLFNNSLSIGFGNNQSDEKGWYLGLQWRIKKNIGFLCYRDVWKSSWLRYQMAAPSAGGSWMAELNYTRGKQVLIYARYRETAQPRNVSSELVLVDVPVASSVQRFRIHADYPAGKVVSFSTRFEWARQVREGLFQNPGSILFHEVQMNKAIRGFRISARLSFYQVSDYVARIYAFEGDLPYVFNVNSFYGNGRSFYVMARKKISAACDVYTRFSSDLNPGRSQKQHTLSGMIKWSF